MRNIKINIEYDGTRYCGWQRQKNEITVQQQIEKAIRELTKENIEVIGCSRTDSGVHARGFIANFKTNSKIPANKFREAINTKLPDDIVIMESEETYDDFHARYSCKGKTYCYIIKNRKQPITIGRNYVCHFKDDINVEEMKKACKYFIGTHDFKAFRGKNKGLSAKTTVRTISDLHIEHKDEEIKIFITANGFLYNMVRIIVGTLIMVGTNKIKVDYIEKIINSKERKKAGKCMPASGLYLEKVFY